MFLVGAILLAVFVLPRGWGVVLVVTGVLVELAETAFWIRFSRRRRARVGAEAMIGASAEVVAACRPSGQVRLAGELWAARCDRGADEGEMVVVRTLDGLVLVVEPRASPVPGK